MQIEGLDAKFLYLANKANLMLLSGQTPTPVDALLFHDRAYGDYTNLFETAGRLYKTGAVKSIATPNTDGARFGGNIPGEASPGKEWTRRQLLEQQVPNEVILHPYIPSSQTREENDGFLELSMRIGWRSGIILAHPHQLLREILGMVYVMNEANYQMEIYTVAPVFTTWYEMTHVNQGIKFKPRIENIDDELTRIYEYQQKGDLASFEELFAYFEARDRGSLKLRENLPPELHSGIFLG